MAERNKVAHALLVHICQRHRQLFALRNAGAPAEESPIGANSGGAGKRFSLDTGLNPAKLHFGVRLWAFATARHKPRRFTFGVVHVHFSPSNKFYWPHLSCWTKGRHRHAPDITFTEENGVFTAKFNVVVAQSAISVQCDFDNILADHPYHLWAQAQEITQTMVNLIAYKLGAGAITILNEWVDQNGKRDTLSFSDPALPALCTVYDGGYTFDQVINIVFREPGLFMALNDIVLANAMPRHVLINCARCVEAIRHLIAPEGTDRGQAWVVMQQSLNIDQAFLTFITKHSQEPRHGKQSALASPEMLEVRARTWKIMNRFLHYRLGGNAPLSNLTFPLLRQSIMPSPN